jgi:hypothetical protein
MEQSETAERFVSLATLNNGGAIELFDKELDAVLQNILDPNTKPEAAREIVLKVSIKPAENRRHADVSIHVSSKCAPPAESRTVFFLGSKRGHAVAAERDLNQLSFLDEEPGRPALMEAKR